MLFLAMYITAIGSARRLLRFQLTQQVSIFGWGTELFTRVSRASEKIMVGAPPHLYRSICHNSKDHLT